MAVFRFVEPFVKLKRTPTAGVKGVNSQLRSQQRMCSHRVLDYRLHFWLATFGPKTAPSDHFTEENVSLAKWQLSDSDQNLSVRFWYEWP